jgi:hypothetical protein
MDRLHSIPTYEVSATPMTYVLLFMMLLFMFVVERWVFRALFSNAFHSMVFSYLLTGFAFLALPMSLLVPATNALGVIWLTVTWPVWMIFTFMPNWLIPYIFTV